MIISRPTAIESYNKHMGGVDLSDQMIISRPTAIESYNKHMGGVDLSDQRVGTYRRHMKSLTWYLQLFFHILELSAVQASLLHKELHGDVMTQRVFFLGLIDELIGGRSYTGIRGRPSMERPPAEARFNRQLDHAPVKLATQSKCAVHMRRVDKLYACSACTRWSMGMTIQKRQLPLQPESESANSALHIVITVALCCVLESLMLDVI